MAQLKDEQAQVTPYSMLMCSSQILQLSHTQTSQTPSTPGGARSHPSRESAQSNLRAPLRFSIHCRSFDHLPDWFPAPSRRLFRRKVTSSMASITRISIPSLEPQALFLCNRNVYVCKLCSRIFEIPGAYPTSPTRRCSTSPCISRRLGYLFVAKLSPTG